MTLNRRNDFTETEEKFVDQLMKASEEELKENGIVFRGVDYSFMEETEKNSKKSGYRGYRIFRVAIILICFGSLALMTAIWINSQQVEASRFQLVQLIHEIREGIFGTNEEEYSEENGTTIIIEDLDEMERAKKFASSLKIPTYLPEGTKLIEAAITKMGSDEIHSSFSFEGEGNKIFYISQYEYDPEADLSIEYVDETIELDDRIIYLASPPMEENISSVVIIGDSMITITGNLDRDSLLEIAENIK